MAKCLPEYQNHEPGPNMCAKYIVVIGDEGIGKTSLIKCFIDDEDTKPHVLSTYSMYFFTYFRPNSVYQNYAAFVDLVYDFEAGDRKTSYPLPDLVLVCFAIDDPLSLDHVSTTWVHEIQVCQRHVPPIILIGLKKDLRTDPSIIQTLQNEGSSPVTEGQARAVAKTLNFSTYMECSTRTGENSIVTFEEILRSLY